MKNWRPWRAFNPEEICKHHITLLPVAADLNIKSMPSVIEAQLFTG
jgi:hypothetical protein